MATISSADGGGVGGGGLGLDLNDDLVGDKCGGDGRAVLRLVLMGVTRPESGTEVGLGLGGAVGLTGFIGEKLFLFWTSGLAVFAFFIRGGLCSGRGKDQNSEWGKSLIKFPLRRCSCSHSTRRRATSLLSHGNNESVDLI